MEKGDDKPFQHELKEGEDYYLNEEGYRVFTEAYHLKRGYCCRNFCKHCPYGIHEEKQKDKKKRWWQME
jgi:hypothetical protein